MYVSLRVATIGYLMRITDTAQYLLVRLILRKPEKWYRSDALTEAYKEDIPNLNLAINELCMKPMDNTMTPCPSVKKQPEYIVIYDSDDEGMYQSPRCKNFREISEMRTKAVNETPKVAAEPSPPDFAQDDTHASLSDILNCLITPELKALAKDLKVKILEMKVIDFVYDVMYVLYFHSYTSTCLREQR